LACAISFFLIPLIMFGVMISFFLCDPLLVKGTIDWLTGGFLAFAPFANILGLASYSLCSYISSLDSLIIFFVEIGGNIVALADMRSLLTELASDPLTMIDDILELFIVVPIFNFAILETLANLSL